MSDQVQDQNAAADAATPESPESPEVPVDTLPPVAVTVDAVNPTRRTLTLEVPAERIAAKIEENYGKLSDDAVLPGFRRGRAPRTLLQKRFGSTVRDDVKAQIIGESYAKAIEDHKIEVIGEPEIQDIENIKLPDSGPMIIKVEVEVCPKVQLPAFDTIEIERSKVEVTDADVEKEIEQLRTRFGHFHQSNDHPAEAGGFIQAHIRLLAGENAADDAEELLHHEGMYVMVPGDMSDGKGHISGIIVENLRSHLEGRKVGDEVRISLTGPKNHEDDRIREKPVTFVVRIDSVEHLHRAEVADVVARVGAADEAELRNRIHEMLESRRDEQQRNAEREQVRQQLLQRIELDLPEKVTGRQTARVLRRAAMELAYQGVPETEIEQRIAEMRTSSEEEAKRQLKLFFILDQAAKNMEIEVRPEEINGRIAMTAMTQGRRPEKLRQEMQRSGEIEAVYLSIREAKALDQIIATAKIKDAAGTSDVTNGSAPGN
ncbi:MAG: trigger factor [Phycisphaeraceae bacterium]|nr:trigger factor [Phycisphaeraceae bacterium]